MKKIAVFLGSRVANKHLYQEEVTKLGQGIALKGHTLVYGGAKVGTMGMLANASLSKGGKVIGVMPTVLSEKEIIHPHLSETIIVDDMHERKMLFQDLSDVFIAMPGGCGTMEEIFEVITWAQIGVHQKPYCFINVDGFYNGIIAYFENALQQNFMSKENFDQIRFFDSVDELLNSNFFE